MSWTNILKRQTAQQAIDNFGKQRDILKELDDMVRVTIIATGFDSVVDHFNVNKHDELESNENQTNLFNDNIEFIQKDGFSFVVWRG